MSSKTLEDYYKPRISKSGTFVIVGDKVILRAKVVKTEYDKLAWKWRVTEETSEDIDIETLGFVKEVKGFVIFVREAMSPQTLKMYKGYFKLNVRIAIPSNNRKLKYSYLRVADASEYPSTERLHIRHFAHNATASLNIVDCEDNDITFQRIGKPKRISEAMKNKLMHEQDFLGIYRNEALTQILIEA